MLDVLNLACHEVGKSQTGDVARDRDRSGAERIGLRVGFKTHQRRTKCELMRALHDTDVVAQRDDRRSKSRRHRNQAADRKSAGPGRDTREARQILIDVQSHIGGAKPRLRHFLVRSSIPCRSERVDDVRAEGVRVTVRERLQQVIRARRIAAQHVIGNRDRRLLLERSSQITTKHGMVGTHLVIDLADGEMFVAGYGISKIRSSACVHRCGKLLRDGHRTRTDRRRRQPVVYERRSERDVATLAGSRSKGREITRDHV